MLREKIQKGTRTWEEVRRRRSRDALEHTRVFGPAGILRLVTVSPTEFSGGELRKRADVANRRDSTLTLLRADGEQHTDLAFVALDLDSDASTMTLEEIFVAMEWRGRGIGSAVMVLVEELGRRRGKRKVAVWAEPIDSDHPDAKQRLIEWYTSLGFTASGARDELEKLL